MGRRKVEIILESTHIDPDGRVQREKRQMEGIWYTQGKTHYILYEEEEETGLGKTRTTLQADEGKVVLIRQGEVAMRQVYEPGGTFAGVYQTPYGSLSYRVETEKAEAVWGQEEGQVHLVYRMDLEGYCSRMSVRLHVKNRDSQ